MSSQPENPVNAPQSSEDEASSNKNDEPCAHNAIISDCVEIFAWQTHHEDGADFLINEKILRTFLLFLSEIQSKSQSRLQRLICRMVKQRLCLKKLLDVRIPVMTTSILIRQPCLLKRFCNPCEQCAERARFGQEILSELIPQIDNTFGIEILEKQCSAANDQSIYALLNGLILLRLTENRGRFIKRWQALQVLINKIDDTLRNGTPESIENNQLLIDIFAMLSLLVSKRYVNKLIGGLAEPYRENFVDECTLQAPADDDTQIEFSTNSGHIISIKADDFFKTNSYFQGMIRHDFLSSSSSSLRKLNFTFDPEKDEADESDFLKFLHYLSGCREKSCVRVTDAKSCVALLHLSDKYSCVELAEELLRSSGAARHFIDGSNVAEFFPVVLSSWLYKDRFGYILALVFFKFSNEAQQKQVLTTLAGNAMAVDFFIELISKFLNSIENFSNLGYRRAIPIDFI